MFSNTIKMMTGLALALSLVSVPVSAQTGDIVAVASNNASTSTLVAAVQAAGLVETLQGSGPFTVFAPTNDAFAKLGANVDVLLKPENRQLLVDILTYHVVSGSVDAATALTLTEANSVQGGVITIANVGGNVVLNGNATVTTPDVAASNGIIHLIDSVILSQELLGRVSSAVAAHNSIVTPTTGGAEYSAYMLTGIAAITLLVGGYISISKSRENA